MRFLKYFKTKKIYENIKFSTGNLCFMMSYPLFLFWIVKREEFKELYSEILLIPYKTIYITILVLFIIWFLVNLPDLISDIKEIKEIINLIKVMGFKSALKYKKGIAIKGKDFN